MSNYIIYKICSDDCDHIYIGSTRALSKRKWYHKDACNNSNNKNYNSKVYQTIRQNGGWDNWKMVPIEELRDITKTQAVIKEEEWRVKLNAKLNSIKAYISEEQKKEYKKEYEKEYRTQNKEQLKEYNKEYREQHKEQLKEYHKEHWKEYYQQNKAQIKEYNKEYREKNKERINAKMGEKITCECGVVVRRDNLYKHKKSQTHQNYLAN